MNRKTFLSVTCGALIAASMVPIAGADTTITLYRFFGSCSDEFGGVTDLDKAVGECGIIQVLTNKFNAENGKDITVETQTVDWGSYYDRLSATYASGDTPDIAVMHRSQLPIYVTRRLVEPLGEDFEKIGIDSSDFVEPALQGITLDDTVYALPFDLHAILWHMNVGLLEEAGLVDENGNPKVPGSVDELLAHANTFTEKTGKPYLAMAGTVDPMVKRLFDTLVWQQGGDIVAEDRKTATIDTPEAKEALALINKLFKEGHMTPQHDYPAAEQAFLNGEAGVLINGTWVVDSYNNQAANPDTPLAKYAVQYFPTLYAQDAVWSGSHMWVLPRGSTSGDERDAALAFLKFLNDNNGTWARTGHLPVRTSVIESETFNNLPFRAEIAKTAFISRAYPAGTQFQFGVQDILTEELQSTYLTGKDQAQALADAEKRANELLARSR